jgi:hypothetical protein
MYLRHETLPDRAWAGPARKETPATPPTRITNAP